MGNLGKVGSSDGGESVFIETNGASDFLELGKGDVGSVTDGQVVGPDEVRERNAEAVSVTEQVQGVGDVTELEVKRLEEAVVGNEDGIHQRGEDRIKLGKTSVLDINLRSLFQTSVELNVGKVWQTRPLDAANLDKLRQVDCVENFDIQEVEVTTDDLEVGCRKLGHARNIVRDKVAGDCLDTRELELS